MSNHGGKRKVAVTGTPLARLLQGCATAEGASEGFLVGSKRDEETIGDSDEKDVVTVYEIQAVVFQPVFANGALTQLPENIIGWFRGRTSSFLAPSAREEGVTARLLQRLGKSVLFGLVTESVEVEDTVKGTLRLAYSFFEHSQTRKMLPLQTSVLNMNQSSYLEYEYCRKTNQGTRSAGTSAVPASGDLLNQLTAQTRTSAKDDVARLTELEKADADMRRPAGEAREVHAATCEVQDMALRKLLADFRAGAAGGEVTDLSSAYLHMEQEVVLLEQKQRVKIENGEACARDYQLGEEAKLIKKLLESYRYAENEHEWPEEDHYQGQDQDAWKYEDYKQHEASTYDPHANDHRAPSQPVPPQNTPQEKPGARRVADQERAAERLPVEQPAARHATAHATEQVHTKRPSPEMGVKRAPVDQVSAQRATAQATEQRRTEHPSAEMGVKCAPLDQVNAQRASSHATEQRRTEHSADLGVNVDQVSAQRASAHATEQVHTKRPSPEMVKHAPVDQVNAQRASSHATEQRRTEHPSADLGVKRAPVDQVSAQRATAHATEQRRTEHPSSDQERAAERLPVEQHAARHAHATEQVHTKRPSPEMVKHAPVDQVSAQRTHSDPRAPINQANPNEFEEVFSGTKTSAPQAAPSSHVPEQVAAQSKPTQAQGASLDEHKAAADMVRGAKPAKATTFFDPYAGEETPTHNEHKADDTTQW